MTDQLLPETGRNKTHPPPAAPQRSPAVAAFLDQLKPSTSSATGGRGRLIFGLDATASRELTWDQASHAQGAMFEATAGLGALETQLVYYSGFDTCRASRWVTSAGALHSILRGVSCVGGHTQLARVLEHTVRTTKAQKVAALVFVGDAFEEKIDDVCAPAGELGKLGTPAFLFQEGQDRTAAAAFKQIAALSGGVHLTFDLASIARLKQLLAAVAVYAAGGRDALLAYGAEKGGEVLRITAQLRR
jgi:hypothetical protein